MITKSDECKRPFSLTCASCEAGEHLSSPEDAIAEGWTEIEDVFHLDWAEAYYCGVCPRCRKEFDE